jgi:hypothetical protein
MSERNLYIFDRQNVIRSAACTLMKDSNGLLFLDILKLCGYIYTGCRALSRRLDYGVDREGHNRT